MSLVGHLKSLHVRIINYIYLGNSWVKEKN